MIDPEGVVDDRKERRRRRVAAEEARGVKTRRFVRVNDGKDRVVTIVTRGRLLRAVPGGVQRIRLVEELK